MPYYREGHNETIDKNVGVLNLPLRFAFLIVSSDISNQIGHFHQVLELWHCFSIGYIWPQVKHIRRIILIRAWSGSSIVTAWHNRTYPIPSRIYPTSQICPVPVRFQNRGRLTMSYISDPRSGISDPLDLSGLHRVSVAFHPSLIRYIRPSWNRVSLNLPSDISYLLTPPMVINLWGL
jgi:hypothetical protein